MRTKTTAFDVFLVILMILLSCAFLYPLLNMLALSVSDAQTLKSSPIYLLPVGFSLESYKALLGDNRILLYYWNTIKYAAVGTFIMLLTTSLMAYPLSITALRGRRLVSVILTITMFFGGGLIPYYVTIMRLKLIDTFWVMVLPGAISAYNVIVFKTFFMSIPESLKESAFLDGAGHMRVLFSIVLPLSKAVLATFALFSIVGYWNDYLTALLYLRDDRKYPIQLLMRRLLVLMDYKDASTAQLLKDFRSISSRTTKAAATIITVVPILCIYPFMQKYFAKGVLVGSIKA
ncbi:MAG: carbohydrate ABC transporter permease [Clostridiales bacterium]|nr:carbohydrate ABC transporter permease [Clostridiales bacterium]MDY2871199.1 carbohydrate ABC transporter permease [Eubacteriales bacterium]